MAERADVLVAGAGPSGILAAISAAREGARVLLIEKNGILGGMNTAAMVCPLMGFHAGQTQVVAGLAQNVIDRLVERGGSLGHLPDPLGVTGSITPIDPTALKQVYFDMLREWPNIGLRLHTMLYRVTAEGGTVKSVGTASKSGAQEHEATVFIDATGDGDLAAFAGLPFSVGRAADGSSQPMTMLFTVGGVDFVKVRAMMRAHPEQFILGAGVGDMPYVAVSGFFDAVAQARRTGVLTVQRDRVLFFQGVHPGEAIVNMTRVIRRSGVDAVALSRAEAEGRGQIDEIMRFLKQSVAGFEEARLLESADCIGVRESRHIHGLYTLTGEDVLSCRTFGDSVAICAFPIDIHDPAGQGLQCLSTGSGCCYDVPYRVMAPCGANNLLVTGRCVSATHEAAASVRITPTAMALGEAAGIAAAAAAKRGLAVCDIDVGALQRRIAMFGGIPGRGFLPHSSPAL